MIEQSPTHDPAQQKIAAACDALKDLADLPGMLGNELIDADTVTQQILARQLVYVVSQVHGIAFLVGWN